MLEAVVGRPWPSVWYSVAAVSGGNIRVEQGINPLCQWSRYVGPAKISRAEGPLSCGWLPELSPQPSISLDHNVSNMS